MLELNHPATVSFNICDVLLSALGMMDNFLPVVGKERFPSAMPFSLVLPPGVTGAAHLVSPMPNLDLAALRDHWMIASWAVA